MNFYCVVSHKRTQIFKRLKLAYILQRHYCAVKRNRHRVQYSDTLNMKSWKTSHNLKAGTIILVVKILFYCYTVICLLEYGTPLLLICCCCNVCLETYRITAIEGKPKKV